VIVDAKDHNLTIVDCDPTDEVGMFVCKYIPHQSGPHLSMVRFNGENIQNKWAKIHVAGAQSITALLSKKPNKANASTFNFDVSHVPDLGIEKEGEKDETEKGKGRYDKSKRSSVSLPIVRKATVFAGERDKKSIMEAHDSDEESMSPSAHTAVDDPSALVSNREDRRIQFVADESCPDRLSERSKPSASSPPNSTPPDELSSHSRGAKRLSLRVKPILEERKDLVSPTHTPSGAEGGGRESGGAGISPALLSTLTQQSLPAGLKRSPGRSPPQPPPLSPTGFPSAPSLALASIPPPLIMDKKTHPTTPPSSEKSEDVPSKEDHSVSSGEGGRYIDLPNVENMHVVDLGDGEKRERRKSWRKSFTNLSALKKI
jgi:hypothetical protein